jgi:hypothetical protein
MKVKTQKAKVKITIQNSKPVTFDFGVVVLTFAFLLLTFTGVVWACPGCKEALFDPGQLKQRLSLAKGYAWSIGLLLLVPFLLVGGLSVGIIRAVRRQRNG